MSRSLVRLFVFLSIAAVAGAVAFGGPEGDDRSGAYNAGVATSPAALLGSAAADPGAVPGEDPEGGLRAVVASSHLANSVHACAKSSNGQLRLADASGCLPSEVEVALSAGEVTPLEVSRVLTLPTEPALYGGIFGGLLCPANRTLVSSGFQLLRSDVDIRESYVGPGFGLPRVAIVFAAMDDYTPLPPGADVVRIWATCL